MALDSVHDTRLNADRSEARRARFAPEPAIVGGYWLTTANGIRVVKHDGLWGRRYEFRVRGDSLVGSQFLRTDVPTRVPEAEPASAVRVTCPAALSDSTN